MYIVREIFHLRFGKYKEAKALLDEGIQTGIFKMTPGSRVLTDFTGKGYRLVLEMPFPSLASFEQSLQQEMSETGWQEWYGKFKVLVLSSEREIMKLMKSL